MTRQPRTPKITGNGEFTLSTRKIYILLTKFGDIRGRILSALSGSYYTHVSLGLEEDPGTFYSFVLKGFRIEKLARYLKPGRDPYPVKLYSIEVSEKTYRKIKEMIEYFIAYKSRMRYTTIGLFLSILRIPYQRKFTYFCSQFVAHVLQQVGIVPAHHNPALYLPQDLSDVPGTTLLFSGNMQTLFVYLGMMIPADYTVKT